MIPKCTVTGEFMTMEDWVPTIMAQLGQPILKQKLLDGMSAMGREYTVHLDGDDQTPLIAGTGPANGRGFHYFNENTFHVLHFGDWKFRFEEQDTCLSGIQNPLVTPLIINLKLDPFERFHESRGFDE